MRRRESVPDGYYSVGLAVGVHGLTGEVKVQPLTDSPERFLDLAKVHIQTGGSAPAARPVEGVRFHKGHVLLSLEGVRDRNAAEGLRGHLLLLPLDERPAAPEGRWYADDLEGLAVQDDQGNSLGRVDRVDLESGGGLLEIRYEGTGAPLLLPLAHEYVQSIDLPNGRIVLTAAHKRLLAMESV